MKEASFKEKVLNAVKTIPYGKVASYGQIALMCDSPRAARQVGWILSKSGGEKGVPWWRIINSMGYISIKHLEVGPEEQRILLQQEGIVVSDNFEIDMEEFQYRLL